MAVGGADEWGGVREWLGARAARPVDPAGFAEHDRARLARSVTALGTVLDGRSAAASEVVRAQLESGGSPRADDLLRTHLAIALAARSVEARDVAEGGRLVFGGAAQVAECRALADEIAASSPDPELTAFAADLRRRAERAERWGWVEPDVWTAAVVGLAVLVGGSLVFGFVWAHRKRQWVVDREAARAQR